MSAVLRNNTDADWTIGRVWLEVATTSYPDRSVYRVDAYPDHDLLRPGESRNYVGTLYTTDQIPNRVWWEGTADSVTAQSHGEWSPWCWAGVPSARWP